MVVSPVDVAMPSKTLIEIRLAVAIGVPQAGDAVASRTNTSPPRTLSPSG